MGKFKNDIITRNEDFYSHLNMKDITDADDKLAKRVCKTKHLGKYNDLFVQSDTL